MTTSFNKELLKVREKILSLSSLEKLFLFDIKKEEFLLYTSDIWVLQSGTTYYHWV